MKYQHIVVSRLNPHGEAPWVLGYGRSGETYFPRTIVCENRDVYRQIANETERLWEHPGAVAIEVMGLDGYTYRIQPLRDLDLEDDEGWNGVRTDSNLLVG